MSAATAAAQVLPALLGAFLGIFPGGYLLFAAIITITDGDSTKANLPGPLQLLALVLTTVLIVAALTSIPASLGGRRPVSETLQTELA